MERGNFDSCVQHTYYIHRYIYILRYCYVNSDDTTHVAQSYQLGLHKAVTLWYNSMPNGGTMIINMQILFTLHK